MINEYYLYLIIKIDQVHKVTKTFIRHIKMLMKFNNLEIIGKI